MAGPGTACPFSGCFGDRLDGGVAKANEGLFCMVGAIGEQGLQGLAECFPTEVSIAGCSFDAIEESGDVDEFMSCVDEVEVEHLLARHGLIRGGVHACGEYGLSAGCWEVLSDGLVVFLG